MKCKKYLLRVILIIFMLQLVILPTVSNAGYFGDMFAQARNFLLKGQNGETTVNEEVLQDTSSALYYALLTAGTVLAVIIGGVLGIKFMIASAEDKAKIKEAFIPYILGCVVVFGAFGIWRLVVNVLQTVATIQ